jgi:hypothetical protein
MPTGRRSQKPPAKWPFWLLVAAWWCANTPQAATFELILWMKGAADFSHQAQLHAEVAALLNGGPQVTRVQGRPSLGETPVPAVPVLKALAIKRVNLCLQEESMACARPMAAETLRWSHDRVPERRASPPRLRPPRLA